MDFLGVGIMAGGASSLEQGNDFGGKIFTRFESLGRRERQEKGSQEKEGYSVAEKHWFLVHEIQEFG
jgi:hypothetical protein